MSRVGMIALLMPSLFAAAGLPASGVSVVVVTESGVDAYVEALDGVTMALPAGTFRVVDAGSRAFDRDFAATLESPAVRVVVVVGSRALNEVRARHVTVPVVAAEPLFVTETVYAAPACPCVKLPV